MTEDRVPTEAACPECGHDVDHTRKCPEGCPLCIPAMTEDRVPTTEAGRNTLRQPPGSLDEWRGAILAIEAEASEQPAPPLEGMHGGDHECRRCGLSFPLEQPAPHIDTITRHDWRLVLWESHGHDALYGDDGEMQCPHYPPADFLRDHVDSLIAHIAWSLSLPDSVPSRSEPEEVNDD